MTKSLLVILTLLLLAVPSTRAEEAKTRRETTPNTRQEIRPTPPQLDRQNIRNQTQIENRQEVRSVVAENHANRLALRFNYYYERLSGIALRLETRLTTLAGEGKDTSSARQKLSEAKTKLESAKSLGDQAIAAFRAIDPTKFAEQKDQALAARDLAMRARTAFRESLGLLKSVLKEVK